MPSLVTKYWEVLQILSIILSFKKTFLWGYNEQRNRIFKSQSYCKQSSQHHQLTILCTKAWGHDLSDFPTNQSAEIQAVALPAQAPEETHNQKQTDMPQSVCLPDLLNADFGCVCVCVRMHVYVCVCCTCMYELRIVSMDKILHFINIIILLLQYWHRPKSIWGALKSW